MALFPCSVGQHRYVGPQNSAYLGLVNGTETARSKMRLCGTHAGELMGWLDEQMTLIAIGDTQQSEDEVNAVGCKACGKQQPGWNAFASVYLRGSEPRTYFAPLCEEHVPTFAERGLIAL